ncbi:MAG TPA: helix-turn-helix domain-containing protein, partial [Bacillota bacterium]|nr:helix-turn-helix domain-containing protein [Bacillota bacterium]
RIVDVHISRLREKIEKDTRNPQYIKTVRGLGYKMENQDEKSNV